MRKFLLMLGVVALFTACEKGGSGTINYEEGFKYLTNLNVKDAKLIYQKEASVTRAGNSDGGYWKIDLSGKESKLVIKGEDGQNHDIRIDFIKKFSNRILLIRPNCEDVVNTFYKHVSGSGDDGPSYSDARYLSFVDVKTEKIYKCPADLGLYYGNIDNIGISTDNHGNVYLGDYNGSQIHKLDISNFTIQKILPEGQQSDGFKVTGDGFVTYWKNETYKVKCPEGRIVPITGKGFIWNDNVYSIDNGKIYLWSPVDMTNLEKKEICSDDYGISPRDYLINTVRNTIVFSNRWGQYIEFDGSRISEPFDISENFKPYYSNKNIYLSSEAWYRNDNGKLHKLDMQTYQESSIPMLEYEIQKLYENTAKPHLTFDGFRYSDGVSVIGTIKDTGEIIIDNVANNGNKIISLIPLN